MLINNCTLGGCQKVNTMDSRDAVSPDKGLLECDRKVANSWTKWHEVILIAYMQANYQP